MMFDSIQDFEEVSCILVLHSSYICSHFLVHGFLEVRYQIKTSSSENYRDKVESFERE